MRLVPVLFSQSDALALHVAPSALSMTAHTVKLCVVVPKICFTRDFIVQSADAKYADNI